MLTTYVSRAKVKRWGGYCRHSSFLQAFVCHPACRDCYPPPDLALRQPFFLGAFLSRRVFSSQTPVSECTAKREGGYCWLRCCCLESLDGEPPVYFQQEDKLESSNWTIWARWGFPTVSSAIIHHVANTVAFTLFVLQLRDLIYL